LLNLGDTGRTTDEDNLVNLTLGEARILKDILNRGHALSEEIHAKFLELSSGDLGVEIFTLSKGFAFNGSLMGSREDSLGLLALSSESTESTSVAADVNASLLLELSNTIVDESVVEVLTTQVSVAINGLDFEDTLFNGQK